MTERAPHNPFRNPPLARQFDLLVKAYHSKHPDLFGAAGQPRRGNGLATAFWRGFEGTPQNWDRASRTTFTYAAYKAGVAVASRPKT